MGDKRYILIFMGGFITLAPFFSFILIKADPRPARHLCRNSKAAMKYTRHRPFWFSIGLLITDSLFFGLTSPANIAPTLILVGFGLLMLTAYWLSCNVQKVLALYAPWLSRQRKLSALVTGGIAALIALQSIGQLTARDSLLIPLAAVALYAYFGYGRRASTGS